MDHDILKLIKGAMDKEEMQRHLDKPYIGDIKKEAANLKKLHERFSKKVQFKPGDIVRYKEGLKDTTIPKYGQPAIFWEWLEQPVRHEAEDGGSRYDRRLLDCRIALYAPDGSGELLIYPFDSRNFEKVS